MESRETIERRRREIVALHGPWTASNIDLGHGLWTMEPGVTGVAEARVGRIARLATDLAGPAEGLRVLDLGCYEGAFSVELALRGAEVVGVDAREAHVAKARFAAEALGLQRMRVLHADVRTLADLELGEFDVVLCLGLLYHLPAEEAAALTAAVHRHTRRFAIFETQVGLTGPERVRIGGHEYRGIRYPEDTTQPGASVENPESFWPTRPSLLNLLTDSGFTSVCECLMPVVPELAAYRDHVTLVAAAGRPGSGAPVRWPERIPPLAHPAQGRRHALLDRLRRLRGGGLPRLFEKH